MSFETDRLQHKVNRLSHFAHYMKMTFWQRTVDQTYFLLCMPFFFPVYCSLLLYYWVKRPVFSPAISRFLKRYFSCYFWFTGIYNYTVFPLPKPSNKGRLFFTLRSNELITPFLATRFDSPVTLPYQSGLGSIRLHSYFPFLRLGPFIQSFGYADTPLPDSLHTIHQLIKENKDVVVFINPQFIDPQNSELLLLYKEVLDLCNSSIDCYFIKCKDFELHMTSSLAREQFVGLFCHSSTDLFQSVKPGPSLHAQQALKIMDYFMFRAAKLV